MVKKKMRKLNPKVKVTVSRYDAEIFYGKNLTNEQLEILAQSILDGFFTADHFEDDFFDE